MPTDTIPETTARALENAWRWWPHCYAQEVSKRAWHPYPYLCEISLAIADAVAHGGGRIIVNLPPRHGKSEFISHYVPVWFLDLMPHKRVILTTYEAEFAAHWGRKVRNTLMDSPLCNTRLTDDSQAAHRWETREGGGMVTAGIGGPITGRGGDLIIIDDPVKNEEEAQSETIQARNWDWFRSTLYTRCEPGATIVVLMTRWHDKDLVGMMTREHQDKWTVFKYPALAGPADPLARAPGQALCPERYDEKALAEIRATLGPYLWSALYQQEPIDPGTAMFQRRWLQYFTDWPATPMRSYLTVDQAYSLKKEADYTVIMHTKTDAHKNLYVADYVRGRLGLGDVITAILDIAERTPTLSAIGVEIQPNETEHNSAIVLMLREEMRKRGRFFVLKPIKPARDKVARASALVPLFSNGQVYMRQTHTELEDELLRFPRGDHDDLVDALAYVPHIWQDVRVDKVPQPRVADATIGW